MTGQWELYSFEKVWYARHDTVQTAADKILSGSWFEWMGDALRHAWEHNNNITESNLRKRAAIAALPTQLRNAQEKALHTENDWSCSMPQRHINGY